MKAERERDKEKVMMFRERDKRSFSKSECKVGFEIWRNQSERERDREARLLNMAVYMKQIKDAKLKWVDEFTERTKCNYI